MNFIRKITNVDVIEDLQHELMKERKAYQIMHNDFEIANLEAGTYKFRANELEKELIRLQEKHKEVANKLDIQTSYNERLSEENAQMSQELLNMHTDYENEIRKCKGKNKALHDELEYRIVRAKQLKKSVDSAQERWKNEKEQFEQQKINLKVRNINLKKKVDELLERITFYEETENGNVHHYQSIIAKQNEQIKNLKRGMKK